MRFRHMTSVYLRRDGRLLLLYRTGSRVVNNQWIGTAGGHFEPSELNDPTACVLRELRDEFLRRGLHAYLYHAVRLSGACSLETAAASKRVGVEALRALTGAERVVAFGDNGNDVGLFEAADVRIAVGNATEELKALADRVIGPNDANSVAREICEMEGIAWDV